MPNISNEMEAEVMEAKKRTRRHLGEQAWQEVFRRFDSAGESMTGFCKREGLHTSSFQRWRRRLSQGQDTAATQRAAAQTGEALAPAEKAGFIEVGAMAGVSGAATRVEVRLDLGGGVVLHVVR